MSEPIKYTATDIQRYHSGQLSPAERHALEKAALDDPFLADALEGYAFAQTPSADLSMLQQRLQRRVEKKKEKRGIFYLNNWMKVAALLVLVAGGGWLVLQLFGGKQQEQLATKQNPGVQSPLLPPKTFNDSVTVSSDAPVQRQTTEKENAIPQKAIRERVAVRKPFASKPAKASDEIKNEPALTEEKKDGYAVGFVNPSSAQGRLNEVVVAPQANEAFKKSRNAAPVTDTVQMNVTLKRTELSPEETVVLSKAKEKPPAKRLYVTVDSLEPAEGWASFDDYVTTHLQRPEELKEKGLMGEVELQFNVNKEGQPVNITVTQSLCSQCNEEAIRILKEGPKWKKAKKKGKVKIKFPTPQ